ncbi:MAG: endo alpha-1,4 polygalactosaminidase [Anaerolineae bacterium]
MLLIGGWGIAAAASPQIFPPEEGSAQGTTYYVAPTGNDANPGSQAQPWRTIQKAANTLTAGDTVYIRAGTYPEQVTPLNSGSAGNYITYAAYPGETATIDGASISLPAWDAGLFNVEDRSYIRISGLRVINAGPNMNNSGIYVDNSSYIIIENNYTYNTVSSGIGVWNSNNITIDGNEVELANNDGEQEEITVSGTDTFEVKNNHIHDGGPGTNGGEGITIKGGATNGKIYKNHVHDITSGQRTCLYVDGWGGAQATANIEIYQNVLHNCGAGITLASEDGSLVRDIKIYNNIVYGNQSNGLEIGNWGEAGILVRPVQSITFTNNTVYRNGYGTWGGGFYNENPDVQNIVVRNNIFSQNSVSQLVNESTAALTVDYNLIDGTQEYTYAISGTNYVEGNPLFVNAAAANFHLQANSPAIDSGSAVGAPNNDYEGNVRPQDGDENGSAAYDIGAYERPVLNERVYLPLVVKNFTALSSNWWQPSVNTRWQWQLANLPVDPSFDVEMYDIDLFDNEASVVAALHAQGRKVVCYISAGSWENWRPDKDQFPASVIGKDYEGWSGEKWLDIRQIDLLAPIMRARLDQCRAKGFDGIEPDNIDGYTNDTGFPLTYQDQLNYNIWLANEAHARGLSIGLKNDPDQVADLQPYFDWALTEDCFAQGWCGQMLPFVTAGKPVFAAEYTDTGLTTAQFCPQAAGLNFNAILKKRDLDAWREACP